MIRSRVEAQEIYLLCDWYRIAIWCDEHVYRYYCSAFKWIYFLFLFHFFSGFSGLNSCAYLDEHIIIRVFCLYCPEIGKKKFPTTLASVSISYHDWQLFSFHSKITLIGQLRFANAWARTHIFSEFKQTSWRCCGGGCAHIGADSVRLRFQIHKSLLIALSFNALNSSLLG